MMPRRALGTLLRSITRDQWWFCFSFMTWGFSLGLWINLQPLYLAQLGANPQQVGTALSLASLSAVFLYIPSGLLADRGRHKQMIAAGWVVGTLAIGLIGLAPDWRWAIPGFGLYLLSSFCRPAVSGYIAAVDRSGNVTRTFAILSAGYSIGHVLSPALGGWVAERWGMRAVFFLALAVGLLSTAAIAQLRDGPPAPRTHEAHPRQLVADRRFWWQVLVLLVVFFALDLGLVLLPKYLREVKGLSLAQIGQLGSVSALGMFIFMLTLGNLRSGRRSPLLLNQLIILAALALSLAAPAGAGPLSLVLLLGMFCRGADQAMWPITRGRLSLGLPPPVLSLGYGILDTASQIALTLSPFVAGQLYARGPALPLFAGAAVLGLSMLLTLSLQRAHRPLPADAPLTQAP